jgi:uncharacterized membrane protein YesL
VGFASPALAGFALFGVSLRLWRTPKGSHRQYRQGRRDPVVAKQFRAVFRFAFSEKNALFRICLNLSYVFFSKLRFARKGA